MDDAQQLRALLSLRDLVDDGVEQALHGRLSLADALSCVLPRAIVSIGAEAAFVRTFDENLALSLFAQPEEYAIPALEDVLQKTGPGTKEIEIEIDGHAVLAQALDVSGEWFGTIGLVVGAAKFCASKVFLREALHIISEELDNYFFAVHAARGKHRLMMDLGEALRDRVLAEGVRRAVQVLARAIPLDRLLLVCVGEDRTSRLQVQVFERGQLVFDTMGVLPSSPEHAEI